MIEDKYLMIYVFIMFGLLIERDYKPLQRLWWNIKYFIKEKQDEN